MNSTVVLLHKDADPALWTVMVNQQKVTLSTPKCPLLEQLVYVVNDIMDLFELHDKQVTFCSPSFVRSIFYDLVLIFPQVQFVPLADKETARVFNHVMTRTSDPVPRKKNPRGTLYVCSDASKSSTSDLCGWAWYSTLPGEDGYDFGVSVHSSIVHAELEGIMRAIIANKNTNFTTLHVFCDSMQSVKWANDILFPLTLKNSITRTLDEPMMNLVAMSRKVTERKKVKVQWVKGHSIHRLNTAADFLSREARISANRMERLSKASPKVEGVLSFLG